MRSLETNRSESAALAQGGVPVSSAYWTELSESPCRKLEHAFDALHRFVDGAVFEA